MRKTLGAAVLLLLVGGCSADDGAPTSEPSRSTSTTAPPAPPTSEAPKPPRQRLKAAQRALSRAHQGLYNLNVWTGGDDREVVISERTYFNVPGEVLDTLRTVQNPAPDEGGPSSYEIRIRSSPRTRFLQMSDWGTWDGCWAEFTPGLLAEQGIDLRGLPNIPVAVSLVLGASLPRDTSPAMAPLDGAGSVVPAVSTPEADEVTVATDALTALQMIGLSGPTLLELEPAVAKVSVPVKLRYFAEYPDVVEKVTVWGIHIAEALQSSDAEVDPELLAAAAALFTEARFGASTTPVEFERPPADELLPPSATEDQTCAAHEQD